jgi:hypothetical protein
VKVGKSRTLAEALRATFTSDPAVVLPKDGRALAGLARLGIGRLVLVVDGLDEDRDLTGGPDTHNIAGCCPPILRLGCG